MNIEIRQVTTDNLSAVMALRVAQHQTSYIENTAQCLEEAQDCSLYQPAALYADDMLVGFAMYGRFPGEGMNGRVWLDRFLIDEKYQGQGMGNRMLAALISHLERLYDANDIYLSLFDDNHGALYLYQKFGFRFNGELDINGEQVMVRSQNTNEKKM